MKIDWQKRGLIYCPDGSGYFKTHATRPIPYRLNEHTLRLFFSSRNSDDTMLPTFVDVDIRDPGKVIKVGDQPLIELGSPGTLDDSGVVPTSIIELKNQVNFYYSGYKRRRLVSFELAIGVFIWDRETDRYWRRFKGPILAQDKDHPLCAAAPFVSVQDGKFKMWYCSGTDWKFPNNSPEPIYTVFYAESDDGVNWRPYANPVIPYKFDGEVVSAPWVERVRDKYLMWYSTRGHASRTEKNYTIGFAVSDDGISWQRLDDQVGISRSEAGWDSEMICYPALYPYKDIIYMFYSGNHVGRGGIGYAVAKNFL